MHVEDGREPAISEGPGTIGVELLNALPLDAIAIPVGDGALIAGIARCFKAHSPGTRIIGVCPSGSPAMALSWRARTRVCTDQSITIADGLEVRQPRPESIEWFEIPHDATRGAVSDAMTMTLAAGKQDGGGHPQPAERGEHTITAATPAAGAAEAYEHILLHEGDAGQQIA